MVQVTFSLNAAHEVAEVIQAPPPSQPDPGSLQFRNLKEETSKVAARPTLHNAEMALALAGSTI